MQRHIFDENQPTGAMSLMNLRNVLRALYQGDLLPLRSRCKWILEDFEYPTDALAQAVWSGTGVTVASSTTKEEGNYALECTIDATDHRSVKKSEQIDLSAFGSIKLWERVGKASSEIQFYLKDGSANESYWDITTNGTPSTWQEDTLDLSAPDSDNGDPAELDDIVEYGFKLLEASQVYIFDTIKAVVGMCVVVEGSQVGNAFYRPVYVGSSTPLDMATQASPALSAPSANPRVDILTVNSAGTLAWIVGNEASSPVPKWASLPDTVIPLCLVYCKTTMVKVVDYEDKDANPNEGYIYADLRPFLRFSVFHIQDLFDVEITSLVDDQVLQFDSVSGKFKNETLPDNNDKVKADSGDPTEGYLSAKVENSIEVDATNHKLQLSGDEASPAGHFYGTNAGGAKGFYTAQVKRTLTFFKPSTLSIGADVSANVALRINGTIKWARAKVKTAPTGADIIIDINKNGTSIWASTQANRVKVTAGNTEGTQTSFDTTAYTSEDEITIDIDQVGSTIVGADLTVELEIEEIIA